MEDLISVIIPVYKVEKYLRKCINSVINQSYRNLEIILVDDGSPDGCGAICDEYAENDIRIKVIHKANGGLSSARNAGIDISRGEWLGFVDSDDWISPDMYKKLHTAALSATADLAICGCVWCDEDGASTGYAPAAVEDSVLTQMDALSKIDCRVLFITAFNKLYNKKIFKGLRFPEGKLHEDEFIIHKIFYSCEKIVTISDILYMYVQRPDSIMGKQYSIKRFNDLFTAGWDRHDFFKAKGHEYFKFASLSIRLCSHALCLAYENLDYDTNKSILNPRYKRVMRQLLGNFDLNAGKLFIYRHKWLREFFV